MPFEDQPALQLDKVHGQLQQARTKRDSLAFEVVGESRAIPTLLVVKNQLGRVLHRLQRHQQRLALFRITAITLTIRMVQQVGRRAHHAVAPAQLADVVERCRHGQIAATRLVHGVGFAVGANQIDDLPVGLLAFRQPLIDQQGEHLGTGRVTVLQLVIGQVEHVRRLLQLGHACDNPLFQGGIKRLQRLVLLMGQTLQALPLALGMLMFQGLPQGQLQLLVVPGFADVAMNLSFIDRFDDGVQVGISRQQDPCGTWIALVNLRQQGSAIHIWHAGIGHHQIDTLVGHQLKCFFTAFGKEQIIRLAAQQTAQTVKNELFIIHQQHAGFISRNRSGLLIHSVT